MSEANVDWEEIERRLERALERATAEPGPDELQALLEGRARTLARPLAARPPANHLPVVSFTLGNTPLGIELCYALEVAPLVALTSIPGAGESLLGVMLHKGQLLPILDVHHPLGIPAAELSEASQVLVLGDEGPELGLLATAVSGPGDVPAHTLLDPSAMGPRARPFVRSVTSKGLIVLDGRALLDDRSLFVSASSPTSKGHP